MAQRLRLHFGSRRSNTDPLSESCSHGFEDGPGELGSLVRSQVKPTPAAAPGLPPISPDYGSLQRNTSVLVPKPSKKSMLQISLQSRQTGDEELDPGGASDAGSCNSSTASDIGYCSSNSIFESEVPERKVAALDKPVCHRRTKTPLRRCSSLVIFPRSPSNTPPASPVSPVASPLCPPSTRTSFQTSHQMHLTTEVSQDDLKASVASAVNGLRLSKTAGCSPVEVRDARPMHADQSKRSEQALPHCANQPPLPPGKGAATSKAQEKSEGRRNPKLFRSTSTYSLPTGKLLTEKRHHTCPSIGKSSAQVARQSLQRSVSLEVPFSNAGITRHMTNAKPIGSSNERARVHIHVSHRTNPNLMGTATVSQHNTNQFSCLYLRLLLRV